MKFNVLIIFLLLSTTVFNQNVISVYPDSLVQNLNNKYEYGVFYVPKTAQAQSDFLNNGDHLNSIRLHILEIALNNSNDLNGALAYLDNVSTIIQSISTKTDKVIFILEKMPAWLSSSSDGSPAQTPGWFVLNTKPPANYSNWNNMVQQVTNRIVNTYGISNAYFEIWNEPDIGSWTGTQAQYFELFQNSYDAIKSIDNTIPVGGPATNHWANNIYYTAPFGYISTTNGEQSLLANLIDSTHVWDKPLDFISWHNFNLTIETHQNAINFITNKYNTLNLQLPELFISEWNAPSAVRDTDLHYAFATKNTIAIKNSIVSSDVIAAWQDFAYSSNEFHADYGLLTYGSIRKPFFNVVSLASELKGTQIKTESTTPLIYDASIINDTIVLLISNYAPPPIVEAINHTLFEGQFDIIDLDSAGFIDISTNDISVLESIYSGSSTISNSNTLNQAINNSIPTYTYFDSINTINHTVQIQLAGYTGNYTCISYTINDSSNNDQYTYDSLLLNGFNQTSAIASIQGNQQIIGDTISFFNGNHTLSMRPNGVTMLKIAVPGISSINQIEKIPLSFKVHPNPSTHTIIIESKNASIGEINILNTNGQTIRSFHFQSKTAEIDINSLPNGIYLIKNNLNETIKFIKN